MKQIFVLVPLANIKSPSLESELQDLLKLPRNRFRTYEFQEDKVCLQIDEFAIPFLQIDKILCQYNELTSKIKMIEQVLQKSNLQSIQPQIESMNQYTNIDELLKKASKAKKLKEQNKKLKNLLQIQLENTEKVREETQKTMKVLRDQFDALVLEMNRKQKQNQILNLETGRYVYD